MAGLGQMTWAQAPRVKNCCVEVWALAGAQALGPARMEGPRAWAPATA